MKHRPLSYLSGFLLEAGAAAAAGDLNLALALGHPQLLTAVGAAEVAMLLVPPAAAPGVVATHPGLHRIHESGVLLLPLGDVPGEHAHHREKKAQKGQKAQYAAAEQTGEEGEEQIEPQQGNIEAVHAIASVHQPLQPAHALSPLPSSLRT